MRALWRRYLNGNPEYLAHYYWWAYLAPLGVWFFSHHLVINLILFGQYRRILDTLMQHMHTAPCGRMLQLTCAYGKLTPALAGLTDELHLTDVASIQLKIAGNRLAHQHRCALMARMNAESLAYSTNSFDTVIIFFLLHELPPAARQRALSEALRVLKPGGRLMIAEYGINRNRHPLHRVTTLRRMIERIEPFLHDFQHDNLPAQLQDHATIHGKSLQPADENHIFGGYYRVMLFHAWYIGKTNHNPTAQSVSSKLCKLSV